MDGVRDDAVYHPSTVISSLGGLASGRESCCVRKQVRAEKAVQRELSGDVSGTSVSVCIPKHCFESITLMMLP